MTGGSRVIPEERSSRSATATRELPTQMIGGGGMHHRWGGRWLGVDRRGRAGADDLFKSWGETRRINSLMAMLLIARELLTVPSNMAGKQFLVFALIRVPLVRTHERRNISLIEDQLR